ncbi:MAG: hypothetical protein RL199_133 [Pseudomonadota bacterium]|jgi:penicillin amidase
MPFSLLLDRLLAAVPERPPVVGRRRLPGLARDVRVLWTEGGIPHLMAETDADALFAQGYVTALERGFQLELTRRAGRGELASLFGRRPAPWEDLSVVFRGLSLVDLDLFMRQLSLRAAAEASLAALTPATRARLDAYVAGVNAGLEAARPLESQLLGVQPRPWTAVDSLVVWKALAFQLSFGWRAGLLAEALKARFADAPEKARALLPDQREVRDVMLPRWPGAPFALKVIESIAGKHGPATGALGGSNGWALSPRRTASGRAMLGGDPHLPLRAPTPGYLVHVQGDRLDVAGWSVPGVPGVVMGHNDKLAWTITSGCTLDACWALEELSSDGGAVRTPKGFEPLSVRVETFEVRGEAPVTRAVRHGPNGPLIEGDWMGAPSNAHALALRWTGHLGSPDLDAVFAMNAAESVPAMTEAVRKYGSPAVNVVSVDVEGRIGWALAGVAPRFRGRPPQGVVPGWLPEHEWDGLHAGDEMPSIVDPPDGLLASANQRLLPADAAVQLGDVFEPPYRARRLRAVLEKAERFTPDDGALLQQDRFSGFGEALRRRFLAPWAARRASEGAAPTGAAGDLLETMLAWDLVASPDSAGAAAFWSFVSSLARGLFEPELGEALFTSVFEQHNLPLLPMLRVLEADGAPFVDRTTLDARVHAALVEGARALARVCGKRAGWRLGAVRRVSMRHVLSDVPLLGRIATVGPFDHGGDGSTVNAGFARLGGSGRIEIGPVFRHVVEAGLWDDYRVVSSTGQSGDPTSRRYRQHVPAWRSGRLYRMPFSREAVAQAARHQAVLEGGSPRPAA